MTGFGRQPILRLEDAGKKKERLVKLVGKRAKPGDALKAGYKLPGRGLQPASTSASQLVSGRHLAIEN